ncbi:MAG: MMPL family transporter [Bacteroidales bacterium]|nr:MMPL family transporter [Bacteroidales bacterium]
MNPFVKLYRFFSAHKALMYILMIGSALAGAVLGSRLHFEENIATLLPKTEDSTKSGIAFSNIKVKDKVFILIQDKDSTAAESTRLAAAMDAYVDTLISHDEKGLIANCLYRLDENDMMNILWFALDNLPAYIPEEVYPKLDSLLDEEVIDKIAAGEYLPEMPQMGGMVLKDGHLFSADGTVVMAFLTPSFDSMDSQASGYLNDLLSDTRESWSVEHPDMENLFHGNVITSCHNAGQIKKDLLATVGISLIIICFVIALCFKTKSTLWHLLVPILYGILIALGSVYLIKGSLSIIAMGIGAIVMGVAMSYCLHVLTHYKYVSDIERLLEEQAKPVCLGCLTTVGAFAGLLLTSSELLSDFGIFASISLIATTFFALVFLPHFLREKDSHKNEKAFEIVNKINSYPLDRNKIVVVAFSIICLVGVFFSKKVGFDNDLNNIGYLDPATLKSEKLYNDKVNGGYSSMYYVASASTLDSAVLISRKIVDKLSLLQEEGLVSSYSSADMLLVPEQEQEKNIARWKKYWNNSRIRKTERLLLKQDAKYAWSDSVGLDIPGTFTAMAQADYSPTSIIDAGVIPEAFLCNYVEVSDTGFLILTSALMLKNDIKTVNDQINAIPGAVILDPFYYTGDMVQIVHDDFDVALLVSSLFVLLVLLLTFRNIVTTLIAFLPMFLSWYVVQGMMYLLGLQFNLINIMISTFIFGIGVDYSIFVMEGLINKYKTGAYRLLTCHKAAILFSAFALFVVTSSLLFAVHPAIHSIGVCTLIGMTASILITYVLQPLLFRLFLRNRWFKKCIMK